MKPKYFLIIYSVIFLPFCFINAQDTDSIQNEKFIFSPSIAGGQIEATSLIFINELGALVDIDIINKGSKQKYVFGARFSFEYYDFIEMHSSSSGGPFKDYSVYLMHSGRSEKIHINFLGGFAYHTSESSYYKPNQILFRIGMELRYNLFNKLLGITLKGSTSFNKKTTFVGIGIAVGYYK